MIKIAPIILFVYNRPYHTRQTIEALINNEQASYSELFIYSDASKQASDDLNVNLVREYISTITGFKKITIILRDKNFGLARSIIDGVNSIVTMYGKVIVLEDDIITDPGFLMYMNVALDIYQYESKVWHISGWSHPIDTVGLPDAYFCRIMNCWGWATWASRWKYFEKDAEKLIEFWDKKKINRFNLDRVHDYWGQVKGNYSGKIDTWAIFWYATIFENNGLCLTPSISFVRNIGHDGTGVNCKNTNIYSGDKINEKTTEYPIKIEECGIAIKRIKEFYKKNKIPLIFRFVRRLDKIIKSRFI